MNYSIGEVSTKTGISISTLRYYDKEGFFPKIIRSAGGIRVFSDFEMETLKIIECLKLSGLSIKEIKVFLQWCDQGEKTLEARRKMFYERKEAVQEQIEQLEKTLGVLKYKCWYYDTAIKEQSEEVVRSTSLENMPKDIRCYKENATYNKDFWQNRI